MGCDILRVLVSDYDRTLYLDDSGIRENIKAINKFRSLGNLFIIATGRSYYDFKKVTDQYTIPYDYVILNHGATILDNNDNIIYNNCIDNEIIPKLRETLFSEDIADCFCCSCLDSRVSLDNSDLTKIHVRYNSKDEVEKIIKLLDKYLDYINYYCIMHSAIEIVTSKVNKAKAIRVLSDKLNLEGSFIYTIGDSYTDIDMIRDYNGYCMTYSIDALKNIAIKEYDCVSELIYDILSKRDGEK